VHSIRPLSRRKLIYISLDPMVREPSITIIPEKRPLSPQERSLVERLLEHGEPEAREFVAQLTELTVAGHCSCGCASLAFAVGTRFAPFEGPMDILADYFWHDHESHSFGVFVFAREGLLAGLDVYSLDGAADATQLPKQDQLISMPKTEV
jgi:hypothetical protein